MGDRLLIPGDASFNLVDETLSADLREGKKTLIDTPCGQKYGKTILQLGSVSRRKISEIQTSNEIIYSKDEGIKTSLNLPVFK